MRHVLDIPAKTFWVLLNAAYTEKIRHYKMLLAIQNNLSMNKEQSRQFIESLTLPEDVLGGILEGENHDDIETIKKAFRE